MPRIGFLGLGKLGMPVAVCLSDTFQVTGYDVNPNLCTHRTYEHREKGLLGDAFQTYFDRACNLQGRSTGLMFAHNLDDLVRHSDVIFLAIQTPHDPQLDGSVPLEMERADFDYSYLIKACEDLATKVNPEQVVTIISTVLPGTIRRKILPIFKDKCEVVYNPFFIAMGTVMKDFTDPEFVLLGGSLKGIAVMRKLYEEFYNNFGSSTPILTMSIESAELTKVSYNTWITAKICIANTIMEMAHKTPNCNVDDVTNALGYATQRILNKKYTSGGMGDGGGCHPRDNIAMSWLANQLGVTGDIYTYLMDVRENQAHWLVDLFVQVAGRLPKVILGKAFKEETNIIAGSCAVLCANYLKEYDSKFKHWDPFVDDVKGIPFTMGEPHSVLIGTKHEVFKTWRFAKGSVVIDPFRYIPNQEGVRVVQVGVGPKES